jgi:cardiolipin synthase
MKLAAIPNAICIARVVLIVPIVLALLGDRYTAALLLIVLAGVSDAVDGYLAKTFGWRSRLGSLLDPAADKLLVFCAFVTLTYIGHVPLGLTVIVVLRDVVIVAGALVYQRVIGRLRGEPTLISKLNTACQLGFLVFTITFAEFAWPPAPSLTALGAAVVFTSITSGLNYVLIWARRARAEAQGAA